MSTVLMGNHTISFTKSSLPHIGELELVYNEKNEPIQYSGNNSVVFKLSDGKRFYALKCYTNERAGRWEYLDGVDKLLSAVSNNHLVPFEICENELGFNPTGWDKCYSGNLLLMPWVKGKNLLELLKIYCEQDNVIELKKLTESFITLAVSCQKQAFSHGDIAPENIIVNPDSKMMLVDHDTVFFSEWENKEGQSDWNTAYHHPYRKRGEQDIHADDFSFLLLTICLKALEHKPSLYTQFNVSGGLLFTVKDFKYPMESNIIREIEQINDSYLQNLLKLFVFHLHKISIAIPDLSKYLLGDITKQQEEIFECVWVEVMKKNKKTSDAIHTRFQNIFSPLVEEEELMDMNNAPVKDPPQTTNIIDTTYQKRRKRIYKTILTTQISILTIVLVVKFVFPNTYLGNPIDYKKLIIKAKKEDKNKWDLTNGYMPDNANVSNNVEVETTGNKTFHERGTVVIAKSNKKTQRTASTVTAIKKRKKNKTDTDKANAHSAVTFRRIGF
jgi:serine/threonine protein kinase